MQSCTDDHALMYNANISQRGAVGAVAFVTVEVLDEAVEKIWVLDSVWLLHVETIPDRRTTGFQLNLCLLSGFPTPAEQIII